MQDYSSVARSAMRILVIEREPEGNCPELPDLHLFSDEDKEKKIRFSPEETRLIEASNFHPFRAFYHRGAHSGVAADYVCSKWESHLTCLRSYDEIENKESGAETERDTLLEEETKKADIVLESLTVSFGDANLLYEDVHDYIEHIKEVLAGNTYVSRKRKRELKDAERTDLVVFFEKHTVERLMKFFFPDVSDSSGDDGDDDDDGDGDGDCNTDES